MDVSESQLVSIRASTRAACLEMRDDSMRTELARFDEMAH